MKRVVVTGMGAVSCLGNSMTETWRAVAAGESRFAPPTQPELSGFTRPVGQVRDFDPAGRFTRERLAMLDPVAQYALAASREALLAARVAPDDIVPERFACVVGTGAGSQVTQEEASRKLYTSGSPRLHPLTVPRSMFSAVASQIAIEHGIKGVVYTVASACASAAHAIGQAFQLVRTGLADAAITGGSEACLAPGCLAAWQALHIVAEDTCRPFSRERGGLVLAEGAAMLMLEERDAALARGATVLGEIIGFGACSDAGSITSPDAGGMARAMRLALADAELAASAVDAINAHGTGTQANDRSECEAIAEVFGDRATTLPVTATKSTLGHALGASAALELAVTLSALGAQFIPPTANFLTRDPDCPIDCVPNFGRSATLAHMISNSFAFGGLNASILVRHADAA
ncbi:beta-ketoacyl-[acyl-carrier-protein] synthase family protein [Sphingomonas sp. UNC305MFCol5.2]|uniref:beta-ketoacyl-[acyl-carrier-protein] synthase family protein n=1 Tax=Sphingomonas sp. UNC305MFCol5.2 TaxID=1449076 RepID=UPI0004A7664A|nr:beta-ketoacyl-[acyl-carrier-protein] synthase family protein [Sphingomonas sp. UNC305MFCol5.2]